MIPVGPKETTRLIFRLALFKRRGLCPEECDKLADRLLIRDHQHDPRRSCYECSNFQRNGGCFAQQQGWIKHAPIRDMLHVCERFEWAKP